MTLFEIIPRYDRNQALRVKRFLMAGLVYAVIIGLLALYVLQGFMDFRNWLLTIAAIFAVNSIVFLILRSGRNERWHDPSLTGFQMVAACLLMTLTLIEVNTGRGALLLLYVVLLLFGVFRLRTRQFMALGLFALLCYGGVIAFVYYRHPESTDLPVELLQWLAFAVLVPCGGFFAGYVGRLRQQMREYQVALQQAREKAHDLAVYDELTGVNNRRNILCLLEQERVRSDRLGLPFSVCMLDLDEFGRVNQQFGYSAGDQVLCQVAHGLTRVLRAVDELGRYSGEEFLIIMPDTQEVAAAEQAERLREQVENCRFKGLDPSLRLTPSIGVSDYQPGEGLWAVIGRARWAADKAFARGGNQTLICSREPPDSLSAP
ncbi:GGDEF domain-containing protein [Nitrococcus mobilis]|uniref:diguanylate cyclase n=1 Tax=Nitrococcus mobilis Nb-231 TaxID=314278 RepID=A4BUJ9_9GAMM|nr:GGDEF domain-containing protein [Nitrococcus mobilis]EAR20565.1 Response regulator containing a CheY-like receiver domain and a GGDEF domain [Nitrococcus mobilis Nb-231]